MTEAPSGPARFLVSLGQALSSMRLYEEGHPARARSVDRSCDALVELLEEAPRVHFSFVGGDVAFGDRRLRELDGWPWGAELADAGIERLEVSGGVTRGEFGRFLADVLRRLDTPAGEAGEAAADPDAGWYRHIRHGRLAREGDGERPRERLQDRIGDLDELFAGVRERGELSLSMASAVVQSVGSAIRDSRNLLRLLVPLRENDQYSTVHSMNVSVLSIGLAERVGFAGPDVKVVGEAALLHDVGKSRIPEEILNKPDSLTDEEWQIIKRHPADGARILLRSGNGGSGPAGGGNGNGARGSGGGGNGGRARGSGPGERRGGGNGSARRIGPGAGGPRNGRELAAVVAYEHHMTFDGGGYPERRYPRDPHPVSQLVHICDVYDALRTRRPFRGPWPAEEIMEHIQNGSGTTFHPRNVVSFTRMIRSWEE